MWSEPPVGAFILGSYGLGNKASSVSSLSLKTLSFRPESEPEVLPTGKNQPESLETTRSCQSQSLEMTRLCLSQSVMGAWLSQPRFLGTTTSRQSHSLGGPWLYRSQSLWLPTSVKPDGRASGRQSEPERQKGRNLGNGRISLLDLRVYY